MLREVSSQDCSQIVVKVCIRILKCMVDFSFCDYSSDCRMHQRRRRKFFLNISFSSWEMVPRMIGALTSYEAERRTIGNLSSQAKDED